MNMTKSRLVVSLVGFLILSAACSSAGGSTAQTNKTLVVDNSFSITSLDPLVGGRTLFTVLTAIYEPLVRANELNQAQLDPVLAQSYVASPDGLTLTFNLRHDVHFSDGTPMTSADVVFSLMRLKNMQGATANSTMGGLTATASDPYTVTITSDHPNVFIATMLSTPSAGIYNSKVVIANGGNDSPDAFKTDQASAFLNQHSAGSGPYELVSADFQSQIVLGADPKYWGSKKPVYSKVILRNEVASAQLLDAQTGQNTIALDLSAQQAATVDKSKANVNTHPSLETYVLMMNANPAVSTTTANLKFRQAVTSAIDYKALVGLAGVGAVQAPGQLAPGIPGALTAAQDVTTDTAKASSLLAQSGVTNPAFVIEYPSDLTVSGLALGDAAQLIQANLKAVGITVTLQPEAEVIWRPRWYAGKIQAIVYPLGGTAVSAVAQAVYFPDGIVGNWEGWHAGMDPATDAAIAQIKANADPSKTATLFAQEQTAANNFAVFIPLFVTPYVAVASKSIGGLHQSSLGIILFWELT